MPLLYNELRGLAVRQLRGKRGDHTLRPTALVHEAFLRLVHQREGALRNRAQFFALAAQAMRRVLLDHARARRAGKRGGDLERVTLDEGAVVEEPCELDVVALNAALEELHALDAGKGSSGGAALLRRPERRGSRGCSRRLAVDPRARVAVGKGLALSPATRELRR